MARPLRVEFDGALFHVTARGNGQKPIVRDDEDRSRWLEWLARVVGRRKLELFRFALVDNHYHLFLATPHGGLSRAVQTLNASYTSYFNRRHRRAGNLFQGRFKAIVVERAGRYAELSRYIHLNPVRGRSERAGVLLMEQLSRILSCAVGSGLGELCPRAFRVWIKPESSASGVSEVCGGRSGGQE